MSHELLALKTIEFLTFRPRRYTCKPFFYRNVENECHVRQKGPDGDLLQRVNKATRHASRCPLIRTRGVDETIADDPLTLLQCDPNGVVDMVATCNSKEHRLCKSCLLYTSDAADDSVYV